MRNNTQSIVPSFIRSIVRRVVTNMRVPNQGTTFQLLEAVSIISFEMLIHIFPNLRDYNLDGASFMTVAIGLIR